MENARRAWKNPYFRFPLSQSPPAVSDESKPLYFGVHRSWVLALPVMQLGVPALRHLAVMVPSKHRASKLGDHIIAQF